MLTDIREIKSLLAQHGFHFQKSKGQNFLTAAWVPSRIADEAGIDSHTGVLEVGPGIGCLTEQLALRANRVLAVELDARLGPLLAQTLAPYANAEVVFADILKTDVASLIREKLAAPRLCACANLPYNITTPAIAALLRDRLFDTVTVMIQREVADRIVAAPGASEYGSFSVFCAWYATARKLFDVPPGCFIPAPRVTSTVLRFDRLAAPPHAVSGDAAFFRVVRAAFGQRRKTLVNALTGGIPQLTRDTALDAIRSVGLDDQIRGERLSVAQFAALTNALGCAPGGPFGGAPGGA